MHIVFLIVALIFNALANILMKYANVVCQLPENAGIVEKITGLYLSWPFISGLILFGMNLLCYTQALSQMKLSVAYPVMVGAGFAIIGVTSYFIFNERLSAVQYAGIVLILVGVTLVAQSSAAQV